MVNVLEDIMDAPHHCARGDVGVFELRELQL